MRRPYTYAKIVQSAEQRTHIPYVGGSIPPLGTNICGYGIKAIISAFQAEDVGSIPTTHTSRSTFQASMEMGVSPPECEV